MHRLGCIAWVASLGLHRWLWPSATAIDAEAMQPKRCRMCTDKNNLASKEAYIRYAALVASTPRRSTFFGNMANGTKIFSRLLAI
jgi:hypothetical protein